MRSTLCKICGHRHTAGAAHIFEGPDEAIEPSVEPRKARGPRRGRVAVVSSPDPVKPSVIKPKPRGRPRAVPRSVLLEPSPETPGAVVEIPMVPTGRGRGRSRVVIKRTTPMVRPIQEETPEPPPDPVDEVEPIARGAGRPRIHPKPEPKPRRKVTARRLEVQQLDYEDLKALYNVYAAEMTYRNRQRKKEEAAASGHRPLRERRRGRTSAAAE